MRHWADKWRDRRRGESGKDEWVRVRESGGSAVGVGVVRGLLGVQQHHSGDEILSLLSLLLP